MKLKKYIQLFLILIVAFSLTGSSLGVNDIREESDLPLTDKEMLEMLEKDTRPTNTSYFKEIESNPSVISVSGTIPPKEGLDAYDWNIKLQNVAEEIQKSGVLKKYLKGNGGFIIGYAASVDGYMSVFIDTEAKPTDEDIKCIQSLFNEYAAKTDIQNLPLIIAYSKGIEYQTVAKDPATFLVRERPIIGGVVVVSNTDAGTLSYTVIGNNNSSATKGFLTTAHLLPFNTTGMVYQGNGVSTSNKTSNATNNKSTSDALYVKYTNINPIIHVGKEPVLQNNSSRTSANKTKMVVYGSSSPSGTLKMYGGATGYGEGVHHMYMYDTPAPDNKTLSKIGLIVPENNTQKGDSGGPIYMAMNVTLQMTSPKPPVNDYQAFIVGSIIGSGDYLNNTYVVYTPASEISNEFGLKPYTVSKKYLT